MNFDIVPAWILGIIAMVWILTIGGGAVLLRWMRNRPAQLSRRRYEHIKKKLNESEVESER